MTAAPRAQPPEKRTRRPAVTGAAQIESTSSNSAHYSTTPARAETSSTIDAKRREFFKMAEAVAPRGELRRFVPQWPLWCRRIGHDVIYSLIVKNQPDSSEAALLADAHARATARRDHLREIAEIETKMKAIARQGSWR